ncbi:MAG: adenosine deaminase [Acidimicrobiales bacterium]
MGPLTPHQLRRAPKVVLHDHLDGGLRPATIIELAAEIGHDLPSIDEAELANWFHTGATRRYLPLYLETFEHTVAVMQQRDSLIRVARECAEDLAADGVVYAEVRFAPELHLTGGLSLDEVVEAVQEGFRQGRAATGGAITIGTLITAMRHMARSSEIAELALRHRDDGVVGFDIAGAEAGYPPSRHLDAFEAIRRGNGHITIHAGEAFGLPSIWEAIQFCGAERLGHGVRIVDDITTDPDGTHHLGRLASFVRDRRIPLEMCPSSNVHTGAAPSIAEHPIGLLMKLRFRVTVNTDNRLMSDTTMTNELAVLAEAFDLTWDDVEWLTINAMKSSFWPFDERLRIINTQIKPGFARLRAEEDVFSVRPSNQLVAPHGG